MSENKKDIEEKNEVDNINFYLEFIIEGINKFLTQEKLNNINIRVTKYSDIDIAMSSLLKDDEYH